MPEATVDYELLEALRELTKLGPIAAAKVKYARYEQDKYVDFYRKNNPSDQIGADYTTADLLEIELRMNALRKGLEKSWASYLAYEKDGIGLDEFVSDFITQHLNEKHNGMRK